MNEYIYMYERTYTHTHTYAQLRAFTHIFRHRTFDLIQLNSKKKRTHQNEMCNLCAMCVIFFVYIVDIFHRVFLFIHHRVISICRFFSHFERVYFSLSVSLSFVRLPTTHTNSNKNQIPTIFFFLSFFIEIKWKSMNVVCILSQ